MRIFFQEIEGDIGTWSDTTAWATFGGVSSMMLTSESVCPKAGARKGKLMLLPSRLSWQGGRDMCRRLLILTHRVIGHFIVIIYFLQHIIALKGAI